MPNDFFANFLHFYLFCASCELRMASYGLKTALVWCGMYSQAIPGLLKVCGCNEFAKN